MKIKHNNDEIYLATILGCIQKIDLKNAFKDKDLTFIEGTFKIIEDFVYQIDEILEGNVIDFSHIIDDVE